MKLSHLVAAGALSLASAGFSSTALAAPLATFQSDVSGIFTDDIAFAAGIFGGNLTFTFAPVSGSITFFSALLNGQGFDLGGIADQSATFTAMVDRTLPFDLTVLGYSGDSSTLTDASGRYSLSIAAAVPEPETYALMFAGLLAIGAAMRSKRKQSV